MRGAVSLQELIKNPFPYFRYMDNGKIDGRCFAYRMLKTVYCGSGKGDAFRTYFDGKVEYPDYVD